MLSSSEASRLQASALLQARRAEAFAQTFDIYLRGAAPDLASALDARVPDLAPLAALLPAAILELAVGDASDGAIRAFDALRRQCRTLPRHDAVIGHALIASLARVLGRDFDEATRDAWANGYVRLVETLMAARHNRIDLVA